MAWVLPRAGTESMPPPWRGKGSQVTGVDMELCSGRAVVNADESTGGAGGTVSRRHYNPPATRTKLVRGASSRINSTVSACTPPEGGLEPREMHLGGLLAWRAVLLDRLSTR